MKVKCPKCGKECDWENNEWRPFCSERCKMVDLGAWISESYSISGEDSIDAEDGAPAGEEGEGPSRSTNYR